MNPWVKFIEGLFRDFRLSTYKMENQYGLKGFSSKLSSLRSGRTITLSQDTISDIEKALKIKIDDRDSNNITYRKINSKNEIPFDEIIHVKEYPILATVYAGEPELLEHENHDETAYFAYNKPGHRCFSLRVSGRSMETTLRDGDTVLVDMDVPIVDGCLVAVRLKNGAQYIKRYHDLNYAFVKLTSDNSEYGVRLIDKNDIVSCYRVVSLNFAL